MTTNRKGGAWRRSSMALALEPRLLLDAAAATTAEATAEKTQAAQETKPTLSVDHDNLNYVGTKVSTLDWTTWSYVPGAVTEFVNSSDGNTVYTLSTASPLWGSGNTTLLSVWSRDSSGNLTLVKSTSTDLSGATQLALSGDGGKLLVVTGSGLSVYDVDNSTGALTLKASLTDTTLATATMAGDMVVKGDYILVSGVDNTGSGVLKVFKFGDDGELSSLASLKGDTSTLLDNANDLTMSVDGKYLFVSISGASAQVSVFSLADDGTLSYVGAYGSDADSTHYTTDLAVSADGQNLYALEYSSSSKNSTITTFTINTDGSLTRASQTTLSGQALALTVSGDDSAVFVTGVASTNALTLYTRDSSGNLTFVKTYASSSLGNMTNLTTISLSADGETAYVAGTVWGTSAVMTLKASALPTAYTEDTSAVTLLPGAHLVDDNYADGVITIERSAGAASDDVFGFIDGNGLTYDADDSQILDGDTVIAKVTQSNGTLTITFTSDVSSSAAQNVLRQISYRNSSDDPTASGSSATLKVTYTDTTLQSASYEVSVGLTGVNDAPELTTTGVAATFTAQGEAVKLFSNTVIDTVEASQKLWYVELTFDSNGAGEILVVGGEQIALDNATSGTASTASGLSYTVTKTDTGTTVRLFVLNRADTAAQTAALIDGLGYINTASDLSAGGRAITLRVAEYTTTYPAVNESSATLNTTVSLAAATTDNTAPTLGAIPDASYTEKSGPIALLGSAVAVGDTQMDAFNSDHGNYDRASVTITLGDGYSSSDVLGFSADGYTLSGNNIQKDGVTIASWSQSGNTLTIRFTAAAGTVPTTADVKAVLAGITYRNTSVDPVASVAVSVTLTDQAGTSSALQSFTLTLNAVNDLPSISPDPVLSLSDLGLVQAIVSVDDLADWPLVTTSTDGQQVYVVDSTGAIALFTRDTGTGQLTYVDTFAGAGAIKELVLSPDGTSLYAIPSSGHGVLQFSVDADGKPTLVATLLASSPADIWYGEDLAVSEDGKNVYLIGSQTVIVLSRDTTTGNLAKLAELTASSSDAPYLWAPTDIVTRGQYVYVLTSSTLIVYERAADGNLTVISDSHSDTDASLANTQHISVSADGLTIFVANSRTSQSGWTGTIVTNHAEQVDGFTLDPTTGKLTHTVTINDSSATVEGLAVSADGSAVLVSLSDGTVNYYASADGKLASTQTIDAAKQIAVAGDTGFVVLGATVSVLEIADATTPTLFIGSTASVAISPSLTLADAELDLADDYQGASLTFSSDTTASAVFGLATNATYTLAGSNIQKDGSTVATLVGGVLSFTAATSKDEAQAIARLVTYQETGTVTVGTRSISVVFNDGSGGASASYPIAVTVRSPNAAPEVTAAATDRAYTAADAATTLFGDVAVSAGSGETGQVITELDFDIAGVGSRGQEWLVVGGTRIALADGAHGTLANGLSYSVSASAGDLQLKLVGSAGISAEAAQALIAGISYVSDDFASGGMRTITLSQIKDSGGTEQGGVDTAAPGIASTVTVTAFNHAPQPGESIELPKLGAGNDYSATLSNTLFADVDGDTLVWSVSGLPAGLSFDAATRTISGTVADPSGSYAIVVSVKDSGGKEATLTLTLGTANRAPQVSADASAADYTASDAATSLFGGVTVSAGSGETDQSISELDFAITGVGSRGQEWLVVGGTRIALADGAHGTLANGLDYVVSASASGLQLRLVGSAGISAEAAQALIAGISYVSDDFASAGTRTITLSQIKDSGGTDQGGINTVVPGISSTVTVAAVNHAPLVGNVGYSVSATADTAIALKLPESLFSDPDGDALQWVAVDLPTGLAFDAETLTLSGTVAAGRYAITLGVSDAQGVGVTRTFVLVAQPMATSTVTPVVAQVAQPLAAELMGAAQASSTDGPRGADAGVFSPRAVSPSSSLPAFAEYSLGAPAAERVGPLQQLLEVLEVQHARDVQTDDAMPLPDGRQTRLVVPAADGGLSASVERFTAAWQSDVAQNRREVILPRGLFQSSEAVAEISLRQANGRPLPADSGIRLDLAQGRIVAAGTRSTTVNLLLEVRTVDGQILRIPVELKADGELAVPPEVSGKSPLSQLLRTHAVPDLHADAARLLESLRAELEAQS